jgi:hypothetical protein
MRRNIFKPACGKQALGKQSFDPLQKLGCLIKTIWRGRKFSFASNQHWQEISVTAAEAPLRSFSNLFPAISQHFFRVSRGLAVP